MKRILPLFILSIFSMISCNRVSEKTKDTINKTGETVGKTATEFFEGVAEGVDKTLECEIVLSEKLQNKGIKTGTFSVNNDDLGGKNNKLTLYIIFEKDFNQTIFAKAYDKKGLETGRTKIKVSGKADEAAYFDFTFDKRTYIGVRNKVILE